MKEHILVVDDEEPIRNLLSTYFEKRDYRVTTAETQEQVFSKIGKESFDLVILDIALGEDDDGLEILAKIKDIESSLPVIILTGMGFDDELLQEAMDNGAAGYVSKTLPLDQLLMEVHRALKSKGKQQDTN